MIPLRVRYALYRTAVYQLSVIHTYSTRHAPDLCQPFHVHEHEQHVSVCEARKQIQTRELTARAFVSSTRRQIVVRPASTTRRSVKFAQIDNGVVRRVMLSEATVVWIQLALEFPFVVFHTSVTACVLCRMRKKEASFNTLFFKLYVLQSFAEVYVYVIVSTAKGPPETE